MCTMLHVQNEKSSNLQFRALEYLQQLMGTSHYVMANHSPPIPILRIILLADIAEWVEYILKSSFTQQMWEYKGSVQEKEGKGKKKD